MPARKAEAGSKTTLQRAVNDTLRAGLAADPRVLLYGQDIEDPKGGVFGLTRGLRHTAFSGSALGNQFAIGRVATIVGAAVGLAATEFPPGLPSYSSSTFIAPAFNQLVSHVTNLRWRTKGQWACPLVLYAPYGAYLPGGGMWHSQSNEGWFAHMPGLRVRRPSTPEAATPACSGQPSTTKTLHALIHCYPSTFCMPSSPFPKGRRTAVPFGKGQSVPFWRRRYYCRLGQLRGAG